MKMYGLDRTGLILSYMMNENHINVFRITVNLKEEVDLEALKSATSEMVSLFPTICAGLKKGQADYRVYTLAKGIPISREDGQLLCSVDYVHIEKYGIHVLWGENRISAEFFHGLTDGYGGFEFMKELIPRYLLRKKTLQNKSMPDNAIPPYERQGIAEKKTTGIDHKPAPRTIWEDLYRKHGVFHRGMTSVKWGCYYHFPLKYEKVNNHATIYIMQVGELRRLSHCYGCSMTEFLTGCLFTAIVSAKNRQEQAGLMTAGRQPGGRGKQSLTATKISLMVAADLRKLFGEETRRNFSLYLTPVLLEKECTSLKKVIKLIQRQMRWQNTREYMENQMFRNEILHDLLALTKMSLNKKRRLVQKGYRLTGGKTCMTISNFGAVSFGKSEDQAVESVELLLSSRYRTPYNCGIVSVNGELHLSLTSNTRESYLEEAVYEVFSMQGISIERRMIS